MYRNFLSRCLLPMIAKRGLVLKLNSIPLSNNQYSQVRTISLTSISWKKRKSQEEKAVENRGGRVIRYAPKAGSHVVGIWRNMTVQDLAKVLEKDLDHIYEALEFADKTSNIEYRPNTIIYNPQIVRDVVKICGCRFKIIPPPEEDVAEEESRDALPLPPAPAAALRPRAPVVCVMGHVDHGKTTLLDALRDTAVAASEQGGITQHIGAFEVRLPSGESVTFLDTPGHAAFAAMRARGAAATDIVVLVCAADDGVMEQTLQSIRMAREADVPIVVAINKIDKPGVNIEHTLDALAAAGVVAESRGGAVQAVAVSARARTNLPALLDALAAQAQLLDLRADPAPPAEGVVLEAAVDARSGKQATVLVRRGSLRRGAVLVAGAAWARVRGLRSAEGAALEAAGPSTPAVVLGWRELPAAGDLVLEVPSEKRAGEVMRLRAARRMRDKQLQDLPAMQRRDDDHRALYTAKLQKKRAMGRLRLRAEGPREKAAAAGGAPRLSLVVKADADGAAEALQQLLGSYDQHHVVRLDLVHVGVGPVTPGDVELAEAFDALIVTLNAECGAAAAAAAAARGVAVRAHGVIYRLADDVRREINARIPPRHDEDVLGEAEVLQQFAVTLARRRRAVAGCRVLRGRLQRDARFRLLRRAELLHDGELVSMRHHKEEVAEAAQDTECGLVFAADTEPQPGDKVVCYRLTLVQPETAWDPGF